MKKWTGIHLDRMDTKSLQNRMVQYRPRKWWTCQL